MKACVQCHLRYPGDAAYCFLDGAALAPIGDPLIGMTIAGRYLIEEAIGEGGMATVYRARHKLVDRPCAVKVMNPALAVDATVRERFRREAKSTQILAHPNVIEIFDHGETTDGIPYMVMELLHGRTLAGLLADGLLPPSRSIPIMIQLARGIARAHDLGVVHRDLKPENVFICRRGDGSDLVKILDFGIARSRHDPRLTSAGELFGTPQYIAPERVSMGDAGPSVDLYALGVIYYEVATGKLPFEANDPATFLVKHLNERPPAPHSVEPRVPAKLDALVVQLLEKDPRARPVDAHRVEQDLLALASALHAPVPPDPEKDPASSHPVVLPPPIAGSERTGEWALRLEVFGQMLTRSQGARPAGALAEMQELVTELSEARGSGEREQRKLEEVDARGREGRQRFGAAVDALGLDASRARDELRAALIDFDRLAHQSKRAAGAYATALREVVTWEGRSGLEEPYAQLAHGYRQCAQAVDAWIAARLIERSAQATLDEKGRTVTDLDYQLAELRGALASHEQAADRERETAHQRLVERNTRAELIEARLLDLATSFCEPLRGRPELGTLFRRLETEALP
ncbi:MAG TPA: protein kinase [Polyangiaceae bacterium]|nr:protein kinase [Polyangiaceae bacterium]